MTSRWTRVPTASRRTAAAVALLIGAATTAGCTADPVDPERAGTVVVSTDLPFASLNGATAAGRAPGSVLVRGLVQSGFTTLAPDGTVVGDPSFGTVEKVADAPLTVRYTLAPTAVWSDGVPVTPADLLLEWAARSGQLDEVVATLDADGVATGDLDDVVAFGATSPALVRASGVPTVDGATLTVVYDQPVADWQVALDVNLPAHVVGRLALGTDATPSPSPTPTGGEGDDDPGAWAQAVVTAVQQQDRAVLVPLSRVWRTAGLAGDVTADAALTTTTGPYTLAQVDDGSVVAVRNEAYRGTRPAAYDRVRVRTDLDPLTQVEALGDDELDVAAPLSTADVRDAVAELADVAVVTGGDAVLQVVLQEGAGSVFDPAAHPSSPDPAAAVAALRTAFLAAVPREQVVADAVAPVWPDAAPSDVVAAQVGPQAAEATVAGTEDGGGPADPTTVRVLVNTADPARAAAFDQLAAAAGDAGFAVEPVVPDDPAHALRTRPEDWDAALVPVAQDDLPVAGFVTRWRSGGATNLTGHADPALDAVLDALAAQPDAQAAADGVVAASDALVTWGALVPLVRTPVLTAAALRDPEQDPGLPVVADVPALTPSLADLTSWWDWARESAR